MKLPSSWETTSYAANLFTTWRRFGHVASAWKGIFLVQQNFSEYVLHTDKSIQLLGLHDTAWTSSGERTWGNAVVESAAKWYAEQCREWLRLQRLKSEGC